MGHVLVSRVLSAVVLAALLCSCADPIGTGSIEPTRVVVPYVGQGAGALVVQGARAIAFDAGPDSSATLSRTLHLEKIDKIDVLFVSHWDLDHVGGLDTLLASGQVGTIVHGGEPVDSWMRSKKVAWCKRVSGGCQLAKEGSSRGVLDGMLAEFVRTSPEAPSENERSFVVRLVDDRGDGVLFAPGDLDTTGEAELLSRGIQLHSRILLVGHHGSRGSSSLPFLGKIAPVQAFIQAGVSNTYGHPHVEASERLRAVIPRVRRLLPGETEFVIL